MLHMPAICRPDEVPDICALDASTCSVDSLRLSFSGRVGIRYHLSRSSIATKNYLSGSAVCLGRIGHLKFAAVRSEPALLGIVYQIMTSLSASSSALPFGLGCDRIWPMAAAVQ